MDTAQPVTPTTKANRSRRRVLLALASAPLLPNTGIAQAGVWQRHTAVSTGTAIPAKKNRAFGYDHRDSYKDARALYATLYAIIKISQEAQWYPLLEQESA